MVKQQSLIAVYHLATNENKLLFPIYVCSNQTELSLLFPFSVCSKQLQVAVFPFSFLFAVGCICKWILEFQEVGVFSKLVFTSAELHGNLTDRQTGRQTDRQTKRCTEDSLYCSS